MGTEMISDIIARVKAPNNGFFQGVRRLKYLPYSVDVALQVVEAIGKERKKNFVIDNENRFVYENMIRWVHGDPDFKCIDPRTKKVIPGRLQSGIYIAGNTGTGKSWTFEIMSIYSTIDGGNEGEGVRVYAGGSWRGLKWPHYRCDVVSDEYAAEGKIDKYKKMPVICFQDLGTEPKESLHMGNRINPMEQVLSYRGDRQDQITLISSNIPLEHQLLRSRYDDPVASRLNEMCNYFELTGKDRRRG